jgi:hypothetical protein
MVSYKFRVLVLRVVRYVLDVYGFPANFTFSVACCSLCVGCLWFPCKFFRFWKVLRVVRYVLDVYGSLQILGFRVACCSLCVGCLWFPCKF